MFAPGKAIESSLKNLAERRTDIFGVGEDAATEAEIGKKLGDDTEDEAAANREATAWDGHTVSAEGAVRAARAKITLDDQGWNSINFGLSFGLKIRAYTREFG